METLQPTEAGAGVSQRQCQMELADCPLVEIVHFHECLRGEVNVFWRGVSRLRSIVKNQGSFSEEAIELENQLCNQFRSLRRVFHAHSKAEDDLIWPALREKVRDGLAAASLECALEDDHSDEEGLFSEIEGLLALLQRDCSHPQSIRDSAEASRLLTELECLASRASENMFRHLQREETEVLPLIQQCFSHEEMARLVGSILGERPGDLMNTILTMMFRNLTPESRADMLRHVQHAVDGTFFDRWLGYVRIAHQGSLDPGEGKGGGSTRADSFCVQDLMACEALKHHGSLARRVERPEHDTKQTPSALGDPILRTVDKCRMCHWVGRCPRDRKLEPKEFESAVRAIARDASLSMIEKSKAVQILRGCSWNSGGSKRAKAAGTDSSGEAPYAPEAAACISIEAAPGEDGGKDKFAGMEDEDEMAPTLSPLGELGCRHYRRACKLRAACCNRFFTCRLCHDERVSDHNMDRYAVREVLCMRCGLVQPAGQYCASETCRSTGIPMSAYYCGICRLYDDDVSKEIYHCPYCNVCRLGKGLGIDFRHCMTCNACVSLNIAPGSHKCIEQALQRDCPVCNEPLFTSTTHYKVLNGCGHSMHRECYKAYRDTSYTCPICKKSMEDMTSHFANLDLLMQSYPMPPEFATWRSRILCQDCGEESQDVPYHFCYHKCQHCGSYNTRSVSTRDPGRISHGRDNTYGG